MSRPEMPPADHIKFPSNQLCGPSQPPSLVGNGLAPAHPHATGTLEGGADMEITMTDYEVRGTHLCGETVLACAGSWKRRPSAVMIEVSLVAFSVTDNSTRVSAGKCRHR